MKERTIIIYRKQAFFNEELVIVYTRDVSSLKTENNLQELINTILDRLPLGGFRERWG